MSSCSMTTNEFFKTGMADFNPALEENKQLRKKLEMLLEVKRGGVGGDKLQSQIKAIKDDYSVYKRQSELDIVTLRRKIEDTQTEIDREESQFGDTQSSFNTKDYTNEVEELRNKLSDISIKVIFMQTLKG